MRTFTIGDNDAGQRADKFIMKACPNLPKSLLYKTFRKKDVKCNGKRIPAETFLQAGDVLAVYLPDDCFGAEKTAKTVMSDTAPDVFYENSEIVIMKKPVNLPVHADDQHSADTLQGRFLYYLAKTGAYTPAQEQSFTPALCNRLDRNTEGFVIGAKTAAALRTVNEMIRDGHVKKQYLCVICGAPPKQQDIVAAYHQRGPGKKAVISPVPKEGFREIRTGYEVLQKKNDLALVLVTLYTGRTHQIRAQMAALGCPLLGDGKYGDAAQNRRYGEKHQLLAACRLHLDAPDTLRLDRTDFSYVPDFCAKYGFSVNGQS